MQTATPAQADRREISTPEVRFALRYVTIGGCLAMIYMTGISSPFFTDFLRGIGATEFDFGLVGGIPMIMFCMQFVGAFVGNRIRTRKVLFMVCLIGARLLYLLVALLPFLVSGMPHRTQVRLTIVLIGLSSALMNFASPLWFAWMADLVPRRVLNRYWGTRQSWMFLTWAGSYLSIAGFAYLTEHVVELPVTVSFGSLAILAVGAGVIDILLFTNVHEPENTIVRDVPMMDELLEPWRHPEYRTLVRYTFIRQAVMMFAAAFMMLYVLKLMHVPRWQTTIAWCMMGLGVSVSARSWGRIADRHGHRPVLTLIMCGKPLVLIIYLLITPETAFPVLLVWMFFDGMFNSGMMVATNGYMMKIAPQQNRTMFIATITGLSGIGAGIGAISGGQFLEWTNGFSLHWLGREWINYHLLFALCFVMRLLCIPLAWRIREVQSSSTVVVLNELRGLWPYQFFRFPVGLYRNVADRIRNGQR